MALIFDGNSPVLRVLRALRGKNRLCDLRGSGPADVLETADAGDPDVEPFGTQALALDLKASPEAAQTAAGRNHAMARHTGIPAFPHYRSDGSGGARRAGELSYIAVGGDAPRWNAPHDGDHPPLEFSCHGEPLPTNHHPAYRPMTSLTRNAAPPRLLSSNAADTPFGSCPSASGTVVHWNSPPTPNQRVTRSSAPPSRW